MDKKNILNKEIEKDYINYLISNKYGIAISFLRAYVNEQFSPEVSYHLHFFLSYDNEIDKLFILCLDTGTSFSIDKYSKLNEYDKDTEVDNGLITLSRFFVEQIYQNRSMNVVKENIIFFRQHQKLWNAFNKMKQQFFIEAVKNLTSLKYLKPLNITPLLDTNNNIKYDLTIEDKNIDINKKVS